MTAELVPYTPRMVMSVEESVRAIDERQEFMNRVLSRVKDALVALPGVDRKALGKPGAERLLAVYALHPETFDETPPVLDFDGSEHGGEPLLMFHRACRIWLQTGPGKDDRVLIAQASGLCHSREVKYRYRKSGLACPGCNKMGIRHVTGVDWITGGSGWYHARGKDNSGCGAKIPDSVTAGAALLEQWRKGDRELNTEVADQLNTILKMADKRALVAATIMATGWSDLVAQDVDDQADDGVEVIDAAVREVAPEAQGTATSEEITQLAAAILELAPADRVSIFSKHQAAIVSNDVTSWLVKCSPAKQVAIANDVAAIKAGAENAA